VKRVELERIVEEETRKRNPQAWKIWTYWSSALMTVNEGRKGDCELFVGWAGCVGSILVIIRRLNNIINKTPTEIKWIALEVPVARASSHSSSSSASSLSTSNLKGASDLSSIPRSLSLTLFSCIGNWWTGRSSKSCIGTLICASL